MNIKNITTVAMLLLLIASFELGRKLGQCSNVSPEQIKTLRLQIRSLCLKSFESGQVSGFAIRDDYTQDCNLDSLLQEDVCKFEQFFVSKETLLVVK